MVKAITTAKMADPVKVERAIKVEIIINESSTIPDGTLVARKTSRDIIGMVFSAPYLLVATEREYILSGLVVTVKSKQLRSSSFKSWERFHERWEVIPQDKINKLTVELGG